VSLLGRSAAHDRVVRLIESAATTDAEVLITGPSGVGKEQYARLLHQRSRRSGGPFVAVNCGAIPPELFENELFGHVAGAFTGARPRAGGLVQEAEGGTLFLDEVDALHVANQVKLLRVIQEKEYRPLGESRTRKVDVRIVAATNANLANEAMANRFRQDLFFRLRVIPIEVPSLKERPEDIGLLLDHFLQRYSREYGVPTVSLSEAAHERLYSYSWPGNVRELENCARYLVCTRPGRAIEPDELPLLTLGCPAPAPVAHSRDAGESPSLVNFQQAKRELVDAFERQYLEDTLRRHNGNVAAAARSSGKHRRAFFELMRRHGISRPTRSQAM
jgi:DNA-binding NtrC family response regulator